MDAGPLAGIGTTIGTALGAAIGSFASKGKIAALRTTIRNLEARVIAEIEALRADYAEVIARVDRYRAEQKKAHEDAGGPGSTGRYLTIDPDEIRRDSGRDGRLDALEGRIRANEERIERVDRDARESASVVGEIRGMVRALSERDRRS